MASLVVFSGPSSSVEVAGGNTPPLMVCPVIGEVGIIPIGIIPIGVVGIVGIVGIVGVAPPFTPLAPDIGGVIDGICPPRPAPGGVATGEVIVGESVPAADGGIDALIAGAPLCTLDVSAAGPLVESPSQAINPNTKPRKYEMRIR